MIEIRLRWFSHAKRRPIDAILRKCVSLEVLGTLRGWRPKKTWMKTVRNDLRTLNLTDKIALHLTEWKFSLHVAELRFDDGDDEFA